MLAVLCDGALAQARKNILLTPTPEPVVRRMLELGGADPGALVADLGSGDGRIPIAAARDFGARGLGIEIDKRLLAEARSRAQAAGVAKRVTFRNQDLFDTDLSEITVLTLYLLPSMNLRLRPRILEQMQPGTRVVSHEFGLGGWLPDLTETLQGRTILVWVVPARVKGRWRLETDRGVLALEIKQTFQEIEGTATFNGLSLPLAGAHLRGRQIGFAIDWPAEGLLRFVGCVEGEMMVAAPRPQMGGAPGLVAAWRAVRE